MKNKKEINPIFYQRFLVQNSTNPSHTFCQNVNICKDKTGVTIKELSDGTGLRDDIVKSVLYYKNDSYSINIVSSFAKFFNLSIDELCGSTALHEQTIQSIQDVRELDTAFREFIFQIITYSFNSVKNRPIKEKAVPLFCPVCDGGNGNLRYNIRSINNPIDISFLDCSIRSKIIQGVKVPCEHYVPHFWKGDILLLANDRKPRSDEIVVLVMGESIWFAHERNGNLYSIIDDHYCAATTDADKILGYVAHVIHIN